MREYEEMMKKVQKFLLVYIVACAAITALLRLVWMLSYIPSGSMKGTINIGDVVVSTRYDVDADELERYDILVFNAPDKPDTLYIKRLIGLPGETIEVRDGEVYADGVRLDNSFVESPQNRRGDGTYVVPEGCYFFLGDNRNRSKDSRFWKNTYVPLENIQAKAKLILLPFKDAGSLSIA